MDYDDERRDDEEVSHECPECGSENVRWQGGDWVVNVGKHQPLMTRFDLFQCNECGHKWTE